MKKFLIKKIKGFSGITHMLIATLLFQIIWLLPIFSQYTEGIKEKGIIAILLFWGIVIGSSIIPDLDNEVSTAKYQLGFLGQIISMFMVMISSIVTSITRMKNDHFKSQHRLFWHAPTVYIISFILIMFLHPSVDITLFSAIKNGFKDINISEFSVTIIFFILTISSFYLFMNSLCYNAGRFFLKKFFSTLKSVVSIAAFLFLFFKAPISYLKLMSYGVCVGSLFHNIGDLFSLGSIPIFFPIPIKKQMWYRPHLPFQLETGGVRNKVLDFVLFIIMVAGFLFIFGFLTFK